MLCAISGEPPQVPVVSTKSGTVYEKRLIETYINENGTEPATGETLSIEDLIDLKTQKTVRPRPPQLTSVPALLGIFQEEWDSLALETYTLRQNLAQTRQELSNALYQHDAAVRVIARLTKERDEARDALASVSVGSNTHTNGDAMHVDPKSLPENITATIASTQESLSKTRRKRPVPEDWATGETISSYQPKRASKPTQAGGTIFSLHSGGDLALVGGSEGVVDLYSVSQNKVQQTLKPDGGSITDALWIGDQAAVSTSKGKVVVFSPVTDAEVGSFSTHQGSATAITAHPTATFFASVGNDQTYVLYDLKTMQTLTQVSTSSSLTCAHFHPDGHLLAAGASDGQVKIFDVASGQEAAAIQLSTAVKKVMFSENGIWLACVGKDSAAVSIYDIRKPANGPVASLDVGGQVDAFDWDYTGQFVASAGSNGVVVNQYSKAAKAWSEVLRTENDAAGVVWGNLAQSLLTTNIDGVVTLISS